MNSCKDKSKKLLLVCIVLTYMCLAVACRSNNNDNLNSGDMAGTEAATPSPSPSATPLDDNMNNHNNNVNTDEGLLDDTGNAVIIQVAVSLFNTGGQGVCLHGKAVIRSGDFYLACGHILSGLVGTAVAELQAGSAATQGNGQNLMPETETKYRNLAK